MVRGFVVGRRSARLDGGGSSEKGRPRIVGILCLFV